MSKDELRLSELPKTWLIDLDGVVLRHNGYRTGADELIAGAKEFWSQISPGDVVIVMSARPEAHRASTLATLREHGLRFDCALFELPVGERILINDRKPSGLRTALAVDLSRDAGLGDLRVRIDKQL